MVFALIPTAAFADDVNSGSCGPDLIWTYDSATKTLTISGTGTMPNYYSDSRAGQVAPWIKSSSIKDNLEKVEILDGVTNIGENAFYYCGNLKSITIADSVTSIGEYAFYHCDALADITFPESVTVIGDSAFANCSALTSVTVPGNVVSIGDNAFDSCSGIIDITIMNGVKNIGRFAFDYCGSLENISISDGVMSIGDQAFHATPYYNEDSNWENNVLYIDNHLIKANDITGEYTVKSGTKSIAECAFFYCKITDITIPDSTSSISNKAFFGCSGLTEVKIPKSVTNIGEYVFRCCFNLTGISVAEDNTAYCSENGVLYNREKTEIICFPIKKSDTSFTIPKGVTTIANGAFADCANLTGVTIPNTAEIIGDEAFHTCGSLKSIIIPEGVTKIGRRSFYDCSDMTTAAIPNSVAIIDEEAFNKCNKLTKVYYIGDETDWAEIAKGKNYSISDSIIEYCKGISAKRTEDGKIVVKPIKINSGTVILALYDGNKLAQVQTEKYDSTEITFEPSKAYTYAKVMVWSDLEKLFPECESRILK